MEVDCSLDFESGDECVRSATEGVFARAVEAVVLPSVVKRSEERVEDMVN